MSHLTYNNITKLVTLSLVLRLHKFDNTELITNISICKESEVVGVMFSNLDIINTIDNSKLSKLDNLDTYIGYGDAIVSKLQAQNEFKNLLNKDECKVVSRMIRDNMYTYSVMELNYRDIPTGELYNADKLGGDDDYYHKDDLLIEEDIDV